MPNPSKPAASLTPPRPTYGCSGSVISIGAPAGMGWEARLATRPATVTTPARMRLWARARLSTSLRRTMARSNRSATTESFPGSVFDAAVVLASFRELLKVKRSGTLLAVLILDEDLHLALGFLKHFETDLGELDADRKSTRLNSSHGYISYAVFCLKKKKKKKYKTIYHN